MTFRMRGHRAAFVSALLASAVVMSSQPVAAEGADRFAGARSVERMRSENPGRSYYDPRAERAPQGYRHQRRERRGGGLFGWGGWGSQSKDYDYDRYDPEPVKAHVSSPKYYTYKPDELKTVSLDALSRAVAEAALKRQQEAAEAEAARRDAQARAATTEQSPERAGDVRLTGSIAASGDSPNDQTTATDRAVPETGSGAANNTGSANATNATAADPTAADSTSADPATTTAADAQSVPAGSGADAAAPAAADDATALNDATPETAVNPADPTPFERDAEMLAGLKLRALPEVIDAVEAYYTKKPAFVWVEDGKVSDKARAAMKVLAAAGTVGLDPADYAVEMPRDTVAMGNSDVEVASNDAANDGVVNDASTALSAPGLGVRERERDLMRFEMEMSAAALTYALDAQRGRVDADRISGYHDLPRHDVDLDVTMASLAASDDVTAYLEARNPSSKEFKELVAALAMLKMQSEEAPVTIAANTLIKPGQSDPEMANVVKAIERKASEDLKTDHADTFDTYDGGQTYTPELVSLVKDYQREAGLSADGVVGPNTVRTMVGMTLDSKVEKVKLAMERLRWLPRDLGERRVFINQPAFTATYVQQGRDPLSMRVVVGKKSNQTNFFYDHIKTVEFNPYWGVPYSIIVNEMIPKLNNNPYYLDESGYEVTTVNGRQVSSASVDWRAVAAKKQSINVRQLPGHSNALGELKILFPNKHHIYMHDTPAKSLFQRANRAFSHGCVRLQDPKAMAAAVLGKDKTYVSERIAQGKNDADTVAGNIPVYVSYFTAWPDAKTGKVQYFPDVYDRDMYLSRAIEATRKARHG
ncbi:murein L,D-transpeptidase YcbB/YkuD [Breoghania corrubedonensis]|uniref:Murein L,D-transpeptidase YcbB/YkuD n=1 Tax=Breoghania corrubedonensis TaxID=665038 RepID=A0A2T5VEW1_9HYPH|nr:L,D-transpeptidase family protein [Breoghania corrubedonensis]PTW62291.1 murein L,D-transpeptidase YcbB/YkuD [Breoghania corrubedonensis]